MANYKSNSKQTKMLIPILIIITFIVFIFSKYNIIDKVSNQLDQYIQTNKTVDNQKAIASDSDAVGVMTRIDGVEMLTGGTISLTYFGQDDPEWKNQLYGDDPIGVYGCGPTSLAMVVNSLGIQNTNPALMAAFCAENGYWAPQSGSYHSIIEGVTSAFSITCSSPQSLDANEIVNRLSGNEIAIALMGKGHFTDSGHFIILRGVTKDGKILVADPISRVNSLTEWEPELIVNELSTSRSNGAPLWFITVNK